MNFYEQVAKESAVIVKPLDEVERLADGDEKLETIGRELGLRGFKKYLAEKNKLPKCEKDEQLEDNQKENDKAVEDFLKESEVSWDDLSGSDQMVVEKVMDEIRSRNITDEDEIRDLVMHWCHEIGYANENYLDEDSEEYNEEPNERLVVKYVLGKVLKETERAEFTQSSIKQHKDTLDSIRERIAAKARRNS